MNSLTPFETAEPDEDATVDDMIGISPAHARIEHRPTRGQPRPALADFRRQRDQRTAAP
jgi:hypothetical protein